MSDETRKHLDLNGVSYLWGKIKALVGLKQNSLLGGNLPDNANLDDYLNQGNYYAISGRTYSNLPVSGAQGMLEVIEKDTSLTVARIQRFTVANGGVLSAIYERVYYSATWRSWTKISLTNDVAYDDTFSWGTTSSGIEITSDTTFHSIGSFTIPKAGLWLVNAVVRFPSNSTGFRSCDLSSVQTGTQSLTGGNIYQASQALAAVSGAAMFTKISVVLNISSSQTYYLRARQTSGGNMEVLGRAQIVRLSDYKA